MNDVYQALRRHLDSLPGGFPPTDSGVEIRILKRLFSPDEAELARHLKPKVQEGSSAFVHALATQADRGIVLSFASDLQGRPPSSASRTMRAIEDAVVH